MKKLRIVSAIATILIMTLIFLFSSQSREDSAAVSRGFTRYFADIISAVLKLTETQKSDLITNIHGIIRKLAHFIIYTSLGVSSTAFFLSYFYKKRKYITLAASVAFCCFYAVTDEIHQNFVAGRGPQFSDVLLDTFGAVVGSFVFLIIYRMYIKKKGVSYD